MDYFVNQFFFGIYPYIAICVWIVGSTARLIFVPYSWKSSSSQMLRPKGMRIGSNFFHVGILLLFLGHLVGLLSPTATYSWLISDSEHQIIAMTAGGIFGVVCLIGLLILIYRRLYDPRIRATSSFWDIAILVLLLLQLLLGLATIPISAHHLGGADMVALSDWAKDIITLQAGAAAHVASQDIIFKLHIILGLTIFLVFPFTRLVHIMTAPIIYVFRNGYQIVRSKQL